jgi:Flp pilus assembly pilin Flp
VLRLFVSLRNRLLHGVSVAVGDITRRVTRQDGQTTAEYALVILAAAAVAIVLIAWARSSGKLPAFFDQIIDDITQTQ